MNKTKKNHRLLKIGNYRVDHALGFVYDDCHKIYVVESKDEFDKMKSYGYCELKPMGEIERTFVESCPLRFINWADLDRRGIVPQCALQVTFTYDDGKSVARFA